MPNWKQILDEIKSVGGTHDIIRRKYLRKLQNLTGRNVIAYYSGWLQKSGSTKGGEIDFGIHDKDKNGLMTCCHKLEREKGLDLLLHTPGGEAAATESLVDYLRSMFDTNIRAIIPQIAMSGGTMIACACGKVLMGKHSNLGPIDPQILGLAAHGVIEEFNKARQEILANEISFRLWQPILAHYHPTLIGECQKAIDWSREMVRDWLITGMFRDDKDASSKADRIVSELADHSLTKSHARHISMRQAKELGLKVFPFDGEGNDKLQEAILSVHHAFILTFDASRAYKIIENHKGIAYVSTIRA
ncbi:S49 family peptidase [candidate division WOR-3 bacterium]|nr:S49 family peptidase [candidate division WOR-3 bacterium]